MKGPYLGGAASEFLVLVRFFFFFFISYKVPSKELLYGYHIWSFLESLSFSFFERSMNGHKEVFIF